MERTSGCPTARKCLVACLFFDESQQPTCPQLRHNRRCTHVSPILTQSSQKSLSVVVILICFVCLQPFATLASAIRVLRVLLIFPVPHGPTCRDLRRLHKCSARIREEHCWPNRPCGRPRTSAETPFFFNDTAPTEIYTLSLHDAFPTPVT